MHVSGQSCRGGGDSRASGQSRRGDGHAFAYEYTTPVPTTVTVCATGCGFTAIKAAIDAAVTVTGGVIIVTDAVHTEGDITVNKDITIRGQGADSTIVEAHDTAESATDRVFLVEVGTTATIKDMTIRHGHPDLEPRLGGIRRSGGGIVNRGALTLEDSIISDNIGNSGGGIFNTGTLTLTNCIVSGNTADGIGEPGHRCGSGGGIKNVGQATWTHALLPGSPAIDAIPAGECTVGTDQRGISRPQGAACDIGAFELQMDE